MDLDDAGRFADLLRERRRAAGLTQEQLAERAGLSRRGVQDLERGLRRPFPDTVRRLVRALQLSATDREAFGQASPSQPLPDRGRPANDRARPTWRPQAEPASFVGREHEVADAKRLLSVTRLLTLTGTGGVGKTRLALRVANDLADAYGHGVFVSFLASVGDPELVVPAVLHALGGRETVGLSPFEALTKRLRDRHILLVLDNLEHLLRAAAFVADLLEMCPRLRVLVTSRAALRVRGEQELAVPPLDLPDPDRLPSLAHLGACESVRLFVERARAVRPDFALNDENAAAVAEICRRLDGLPLAIELAAARTGLLPPRALLARMTSRLPLLTFGPRDAPARHQTLRAAIAWSYDLLGPAEQALFRRLAVFVGGCTLDAAEAVCLMPEGMGMHGDVRRQARTPVEHPPSVLDLAASLVAHHLVRSEETASGDVRLAMLETIREFALEQTSMRGETDVLCRRHADYELALAEDIEPRLFGPEQRPLLDRLEEEHSNLLAALRWLTGHGDMELALRLGGALYFAWFVRGRMAEGLRILVPLLASPEAAPPTLGRARALFAVALWAYGLTDLAGSRARYEEAEAIYRRLEDAHGVARALYGEGMVACQRRDFASARPLLEKGLPALREAGDRWLTGLTQGLLGEIAFEEGDEPRARNLYEQALALHQEEGNEVGRANVLSSLGDLSRLRGEDDQARALYEEALAIYRAQGARRLFVRPLRGLVSLASDGGRFDEARALLVEKLAISRAEGSTPGVLTALNDFAYLAARQGRRRRALRLAAAGLGWLPEPIWPLGTRERTALERALEPARQALGEGSAAAAWAEGRALTLEQAIAEALDEGSDSNADS